MKSALLVVAAIIASCFVLMLAVDALVLNGFTPAGTNLAAMKACAIPPRGSTNWDSPARIRACYARHGGTGYLQVATVTKS